MLRRRKRWQLFESRTEFELSRSVGAVDRAKESDDFGGRAFYCGRLAAIGQFTAKGREAILRSESDSVCTTEALRHPRYRDGYLTGLLVCREEANDAGVLEEYERRIEPEFLHLLEQGTDTT